LDERGREVKTSRCQLNYQKSIWTLKLRQDLQIVDVQFRKDVAQLPKEYDEKTVQTFTEFFSKIWDTLRGEYQTRWLSSKHYPNKKNEKDMKRIEAKFRAGIALIKTEGKMDYAKTSKSLGELAQITLSAKGGDPTMVGLFASMTGEKFLAWEESISHTPVALPWPTSFKPLSPVIGLLDATKEAAFKEAVTAYLKVPPAPPTPDLDRQLHADSVDMLTVMKYIAIALLSPVWLPFYGGFKIYEWAKDASD